MKSTLIRIFAIMTLATSMSAFAMSDKAAATENTNCNNAKSEATTVANTPDGGKTDQTDEGQSDNSQEKSRKQQLIEQQEKQWLQDLQGVYGG